MTIPSFSEKWLAGTVTAPKIYILEIRKPDRSPPNPVAWLLVERQETIRFDERDNTVFEAAIELHFEEVKSVYERGRRTRGSFRGSYRAIGCAGPWVSLTSHSYGHGAVFLDPSELRGHRVGTYLMNEIVIWAKQWPNATVNPIELLKDQAYDENRARRNRFYEQFGLTFDYLDNEGCAGLSRSISADLLTPVDTWKANLRILQVQDFVGELLQKRHELECNLKQRKTAMDGLISELDRASRRPIWWAARRLWGIHRGTVTTAGMFTGMAALFWWKWPV